MADEVKVDGVGVVLVHCGVGGGWGGAGMRTCNSRLLLMGRVGADKAQGFYSTPYPLVCPQVSQDNFVWNRILKEVVTKKWEKDKTFAIRRHPPTMGENHSFWLLKRFLIFQGISGDLDANLLKHISLKIQ